MNRRGFLLEDENQAIKSKKELKKRMVDFKSAVCSKYLRLKYERFEFDKKTGEVDLNCKIILDCRDDPYLENYNNGIFHRKDVDKEEFTGCATQFYVTDEYMDMVKRECLRIFGINNTQYRTSGFSNNPTLYVTIETDIKPKVNDIEYANPTAIVNVSKVAPPPNMRDYKRATYKRRRF